MSASSSTATRRPRKRSSSRARVLLGALAGAVTLAAAGCGGAGPGRALALPPPGALPASGGSHVAIILMENQEFGDVIGNRSAPFVNSLLGGSALASSYFAISHPSLPNYLALTSGSTFGIHSDCTDCRVGATNLIDQLERARVSWKAYMEGLPAPCSGTSSAGGYALKHDPFLYYKDVRANRARCRRVVGFNALASDLRAGTLPSFAWVSPNLCDDGHDCSIGQADRFLRGLVPSLVRELGPRGFLILTWDEGSSNSGCCRLAAGGHVATIVTGPQVRAGMRNATAMDHYSTLRTIEDAFGLGRLRGAACPCTASLDALFAVPPRGLRSAAPASARSAR